MAKRYKGEGALAEWCMKQAIAFHEKRLTKGQINKLKKAHFPFEYWTEQAKQAGLL